MIHFLTVAQILVLHDESLQRYGGSPGVRDLGLIDSAACSTADDLRGCGVVPDTH